MTCSAQNGRNAALIVFLDRTENSGKTGTERKQEFEPLINTNKR
jgi:hypothetical protein